MGRDDRSPDEEWFTLDARGRPEEPEDDGGGRRRRPSVLTVLLGLVVLTLAGIAWANQSRDQAVSRPTPTTSRPTTSTPARTSSPAATSPTPQPTVTRTSLGGPPLGPTAPWDLFLLRTSALVRVEMGSGRTTTTSVAVGDLQQVNLLPLEGRVLVSDFDPGGTTAVVGDDGTSRTSGLPAGVVFPASRADRLWWASTEGGEQGRVEQRTTDGRAVPGTSVALPLDLYGGSARSDGAGGVLVDGQDGTYRVERGGLRRVTTGTVLAVAPAGWLVNECDDDHRCRLAFVDRGNRSRRSLGEAVSGSMPASIDPAGRLAVLQEFRWSGMVVSVLDLGTGRRRVVEGLSPRGGPSSMFAWSPDGRWFVAVGDQGGVVALEVATGHLTTLFADEDSPSALAVR